MGRASPRVWAGVALIVLLILVDIALIVRETGHSRENLPVAPPSVADEKRWRIPKAARDAVLRDLQGSEPDAEFSPGPGLTVERLAPDSPLTLAGLRPKDRIVSINGSPVQGGGAKRLLEEAATARSLRMKVQREGRTLDYRFDFE